MELIDVADDVGGGVNDSDDVLLIAPNWRLNR